MFPSRLFLMLAMLGSSSALAAQQGETVGPPVLRDFELPGTRETPPAEPQDVPQAEPEPEPAAQPEQPAERPQPRPRAESPSRAVPPSRAPAATVAPQPAPILEAPVAAEPPPPPPVSEATPPPAAARTPVENAAPEEGFPLWWAAAGGVAALLLCAAWLLRRRRRDDEQVEPAPVTIAPPPPPPPPSAPVAPPVKAPMLEVVFRPERMVATDKDVTVHFALRVKNAGAVEVRNLLIDGKLFSAGPEQTREIAEFLKAPIGRGASAVPFGLEPGRGAEFGSAVFMPKDEVREIMLQGRPLFVPTVALKIGYAFGEGRQAVMTGTYLVGIEPKDSAQKMGAFRLDQGPRVYRSVGQRQIELA